MRKAPGRSLIPPPLRHPSDEAPPPENLYTEPEHELLILGEMLYDVELMGQQLRTLPFDRDHYRANLRIVAGAAVRTKQRCTRLLGERAIDLVGRRQDQQAAAEPGALEPGALTTVLRDYDEHGKRPLVSELDAESERVMETIARSPNLLDRDPVASGTIPITHENGTVERVPLHSDPDRKNGDADPSQPGKEAAPPEDRRPKPKGVHTYTAIESMLMSELKIRGTATTAELLDAIAQERRVPVDDIHTALADLRKAKRVTTTRLGRSMINQIAEAG